jgi:PAS domain S-box-containing protein
MQKLQNKELIITSMVEASPNALILVDSQHKIIYANNNTQELFQYSKKELYGKAIEMLIPQKNRSSHTKLVHEYMQSPQTRMMGQGRDLYALKKDQSKFPVEIGLTLLNVKNQNFILATITDITERKTAEKKITESENKLKTTFEILDVGMIITDRQGRIIDCNNASEKILGIPKEDILSSYHWETKWNLIRADNTPMPTEELASVRALESNQPVRNVETGIVKEFGEITWVLANAAPLYVEGYGVVITYIDITEQKRAENAFKASEEILQKINSELKSKNKAIGQSIDYARKIQYSILPDVKQIKCHFPDIQIYYQPKDTIGGDFYWYHQKKDLAYIAAVDCTGHNVPGAMISMIVNSLLTDIVTQNNHLSTGEILSKLHNDLYNYLHQEKGDEYSQDGCDISLCCIDLENKRMQYSGARQDLYIFKNNNVKRIRATSKSIGGLSMIGTPEPERVFETKSIKLTDDSTIAMTTDGITDQLNAEDNIFGRQRLTEMLLEMNNFSESEKGEFVAEKINKWKLNTSQQDDMLLITFKIPGYHY